MTTDRRSLVASSIAGTMLQVAMVVIGHSSPAVAALYAVGGMGISLVAGVLYGVLARGLTTGSATLGGSLAGGICAFIGIGVSFILGDVPPSLLALGTISSMVTGAIGGAAAGWLERRRAA